ncbi:MAG TPA: HAMP domain-containing sensor histidine kinase, partial [Longimicrobiales bacterium]|nr:HAMP domain-containing sensor histidine kinase [Longimicrobiales bacterium]
MSRRHWPAILAVLAVVIFGSYLVYTQHLVSRITREATVYSRIYAEVSRGLLSPDEQAATLSLLVVQDELQELGVPMILVNGEGVPWGAVNLPFEADVADPADWERIGAYADQLARQIPPISDPVAGTIYVGAPPLLRWLRWLPWLQVVGGGLILAAAIGLLRVSLRSERERLFAAMARELAHQMGTPLSSLAGWVELLRLPDEERSGMAATEAVAEEIAADVERLERVSRRFEMIGKPSAVEAVAARRVVDELEGYLRPRLPRLGAGIKLRMRVAEGLPPLRANRVLLVWALENLVKNALDALAGASGRIQVVVTRGGPGQIRILVGDTGPGIAPHVRDRVFEPGVTT